MNVIICNKNKKISLRSLQRQKYEVKHETTCICQKWKNWLKEEEEKEEEKEKQEEKEEEEKNSQSSYN